MQGEAGHYRGAAEAIRRAPGASPRPGLPSQAAKRTHERGKRGKKKELGGIYHSHVRYRLGDRSGSVQRSHRHRPVSKRKKRREGDTLAQIDWLNARGKKKGSDVTFDSSVRRKARGGGYMFPEWSTTAAPTSDRGIAPTKWPARKEREDIWLTYFKRPQNHVYEGRTVAEIAGHATRERQRRRGKRYIASTDPRGAWRLSRRPCGPRTRGSVGDGST